MATLYTPEQLRELLNKEAPYFVELQKQLEQTDNGIISVQVRKHKGKITDYVVTVSARTVIS
jgi:hypothetical protein